MRKLILFINRLFAKLNIFSKKVYYVGGNDSLPPPLKKDEEEELVQELINGKEGVRDILIERNLRLVVYIAIILADFECLVDIAVNSGLRFTTFDMLFNVICLL